MSKLHTIQQQQCTQPLSNAKLRAIADDVGICCDNITITSV